LRAAGLDRIEQCDARDTGRGEFYFALIERAGRATAEVLPEIVHAAIAELPWPKSMRFPAASFRWVRPLTSVICLFDGEIVPLQLGEVPVGRTTRGHRFLLPEEFSVENAADYRQKLEAAHVVLDQDRRRQIIEVGLNELAQSAGLKVKPDPGLLEEVTGLVEYPVVLMGTIDAESMALPPEVLATAMRTHQKYFTCLNPDGTTAPRFLFVANNQTPDDGATITAGNERVLKARLADARFFWDQDRKVPLTSRVEALKDRVYHEKLGSVYDKVRRMEKLAEFLVDHVPDADGERSGRAVHLAKADLSTGMVGEFPELQGVMGRYYALFAGNENEREHPAVANAIAEHYKPLGPNDACPTAPDSIVTALADKLDSVVGFFAAGERPTGSGDPYALRRAGLGIIRLILENHIRADLGRVLSRSSEIIYNQLKLSVATVNEDVLNFIVERLKIHLRAQGVRHDLIAAVFGRAEYDLVRLLARVAALGRFLASEDGSNLIVAYRRASNIVGIERGKGGWSDGEPVDQLLSQPEERELSTRLGEVRRQADRALTIEDFPSAMAVLATLRRPVDEFFDKVTVNAGDPELRANRLRLLSRIRATMNQVADFSQIEG
jgi:glycyl-tRNA synthetase beta chain